MNNVTKEYIDLFEMVDEAQEKVDSFIDLISGDLAYSQRSQLLRIRDSLDWNEMREYLGVSIEAQLSQDEISEIISTYKSTPALRKLLAKRKHLDASCKKIAEKVVSDSIDSSAYVMHNNLVH